MPLPQLTVKDIDFGIPELQKHLEESAPAYTAAIQYLCSVRAALVSTDQRHATPEILAQVGELRMPDMPLEGWERVIKRFAIIAQSAQLHGRHGAAIWFALRAQGWAVEVANTVL